MAKSAIHKIDFAGTKEYLILPRAVLESQAYNSLSLRARAVLTLLHLRFNGFNNGSIALPARDIGEALTKSHAQNLEAVDELIEHGLVALAKDYPKVQRMAREYRLTFISSGTDRHPEPATNDYLSWEREKSPVRTVRTARPFPVRTSRTDAENPVRTSRTDHAETPDFAPDPVRTVRTHLVSHTCDVDRSSSNLEENSGGRFFAEPIKPQSMTTERWEMALRRAAENPAAPDAEELRPRVAEIIKRIGRGTQRRIAQASGVSEPALSKFLKGTSDLSGFHRVQIAAALPALFANRKDAA